VHLSRALKMMLKRGSVYMVSFQAEKGVSEKESEKVTSFETAGKVSEKVSEKVAAFQILKRGLKR
jgi:hypothetical protein